MNRRLGLFESLILSRLWVFGLVGVAGCHAAGGQDGDSGGSNLDDTVQLVLNVTEGPINVLPLPLVGADVTVALSEGGASVCTAKTSNAGDIFCSGFMVGQEVFITVEENDEILAMVGATIVDDGSGVFFLRISTGV